MSRDPLVERLESRTSDDSQMIDAIWEARRQNRTDLAGRVVSLLEHSSPMVREEALNLLAVKWRKPEAVQYARHLIHNDPDFGVRSAAAWAIGMLSDPSPDSISILRTIILDARENVYVREAAYQGLCRLLGKSVPALSDPAEAGRILDLAWVQNLGS